MLIRQQLTTFFYIVFIIAILCSKTLLTIAMIGLAIAAVFDISIQPFKIGFNHNFFKNLQELKTPTYIAIIGIFILILLSGINSEELTFWSKQVRLKLPFLVLPIIFVNLPKLTERQFSQLIYFFLLAVSTAAFGVLINYLLDYTYINDQILKGTPIPTPIHHIRFSLLAAFGVICGLWLTYNHFQWRYNWERNLLIGLSIFLFIFLHILSVKSGLLLLYAGISIMGVYYIIHTKRLWLFAVLIPMIFLLPYVAYKTVKPFYNKVSYFLYDLDMFSQGKLEGLSDAQRLVSLDVGWRVFQENPTAGTGLGDLKSALHDKYEAHYPTLEMKLPHNQYLWFASSMGIFGLIAFVTCFFSPLFYKKRYRSVLFATFYAMIALSFMFENTLSTAIGTSIYLFFTLLFLRKDNF